MRLRICGTVFILNRKQSVIILLVTSALVGVLHVVSQGAGDGDGEFQRTAFIDDVLQQRRQPEPRHVDPAAPRKGNRGRRRAGRSGRVVMAMDEARAQRGALIDEARRRLIADQRRAPDSRYNINVTLSDLTSPDRYVADTRPPACLTMPYYSATQLPTATVIIPFYNEALTMLLRAVHSVLNKSPDHLLDEVPGATKTSRVYHKMASQTFDFVESDFCDGRQSRKFRVENHSVQLRTNCAKG